MADEEGNIIIEGGDDDEEGMENQFGDDKFLEESNKAKDIGLVENKDNKRQPFDSASYYKEQQEKKNKEK